MSSIESSAEPRPYSDQGTGLLVFGIFQVLIGGMCGLMIPLMVVGATLQQPGGGAPLGIRQLIPAAVAYLVIATTGICLGIGSI